MKRLVALALVLAFCLAIAAPALAQEGAAGTGDSGAAAPAEMTPPPAEAGPAAAEPTPSEDEGLPPELATAVQSLSPAQLKALAELVRERLRELERQREMVREEERLREMEQEREREKAREGEQKAKPKPKPKYEKFKGRVKLNGRELKFDQPPVIRDGRILVPLRAISEGLKAEVRWDPAARTVTVIKGDTTVVLFLDKAEVLVNGETVALDVPAVAVNSRTLVPLRFLNQVFGNRVKFDEETGEVEIEEEAEKEVAEEEEIEEGTVPVQPEAGQEQSSAAGE